MSSSEARRVLLALCGRLALLKIIIPNSGIPTSQGKYDDAKPLYERSLAIREKALGAEHPDVAHSLNKLAGLLKAQVRNEQF